MMFLSTDHLFEKKKKKKKTGQVTMDLLYIKFKYLTDSPCGNWGRGWTTYLLNDGPLLPLGL